VTLFFPKGIVGTIQHTMAGRRGKGAKPKDNPAKPGNDDAVAHQAAE